MDEKELFYLESGLPAEENLLDGAYCYVVPTFKQAKKFMKKHLKKMHKMTKKSDTPDIYDVSFLVTRHMIRCYGIRGTDKKLSVSKIRIKNYTELWKLGQLYDVLRPHANYFLIIETVDGEYSLLPGIENEDEDDDNLFEENDEDDIDDGILTKIS